MELLIDSFISALQLVLALDPEILTIVWVSLKVSGTSTLLASLMGVPLGFIIAFHTFAGKRLLITVLN
ncbi:MAG: ABC transporter permease, partial [Desulfobacterales bacterium]|nr:ABC transporter permease [Desulfobacterales bacterium]